MNIMFFLTPKCDTAYINDDCTLRQALEKMKHYGFTAIPVINWKGEYVGTLSEGDLLWAILGNSAYADKDREQHLVKNILKGRQNTPVSVGAGIEDLFILSMNQNFIPVTDDRNLFIGIVTRRDILQYFYDKAFKNSNSTVINI